MDRCDMRLSSVLCLRLMWDRSSSNVVFLIFFQWLRVFFRLGAVSVSTRLGTRPCSFRPTSLLHVLLPAFGTLSGEDTTTILEFALVIFQDISVSIP